MKIFFIPRGWPTQQKPQLGNFERDQAIALRKLGHDVYSIYLDIRPDSRDNKVGISREIFDDIVVYCLRCGQDTIDKISSEPPNAQYQIVEGLFMSLFDYVLDKEGRPDLVYGHYLRYCRRALAIKRKYGIPAVGIEHWSELGKETIREDLLMQAKETYPYLDKLLTVSNFLRDNIKKNIGVEAEVVYDTYDDAFSYKERNKKDDIVRFVLTGSLLPIKRFDIVILALHHISNLPDNVQFIIIGDNVERERLQKLIDEFNLNDKVHLVGRKNRAYIADALHEADVFILSSDIETFGVAPLEALACGVPLIATDCGGSRSYMNDFNGIMIPVGDVDAMKKAIMHMYHHHNDFNRKRIAEDCRERFSSKVIAKQLESLFESVISPL